MMSLNHAQIILLKRNFLVIVKTFIQVLKRPPTTCKINPVEPYADLQFDPET